MNKDEWKEFLAEIKPRIGKVIEQARTFNKGISVKIDDYGIDFTENFSGDISCRYFFESGYLMNDTDDRLYTNKKVRAQAGSCFYSRIEKALMANGFQVNQLDKKVA